MGASGPVYRAKTDTGDVAIRQFESKEDPASQAWLDERQRFLQAGRQSLGLTHPRIVPVLDVIDEAGEAGIVMEYMAAPTLATALLATRRFTPAETETVLRQVAMALDFAHGRGVVHGDLKPSDIFLTERGARLSDFGSSPRARRFDHDPVPARLVHGYLSPEHLRDSASIGPRSDQYSLAVIAYQMYTGQSPYGSHVLDPSPAILSASIAPPSQVDRQLPRGIDEPLLRALDRDPDKRFGTCMELFAFLGASLITQPEPAGKRIPKAVYLVVPLLLLALLALIWFLAKKSPKDAGDRHGHEPVVPAQGTTTTGSTQTSAPSGKKTGKKTSAPFTGRPTQAPHPLAPTRGIEPEPPIPPVATTPGFTIDILSREQRIENNSIFSFRDPKLGGLGLGDLSALVGFEGRRLQRDHLELKWTVDDVPMGSKAIKFQSGDKQTIMVKYGNEPTVGRYKITLVQNNKRVVQSFAFEITQ